VREIVQRFRPRRVDAFDLDERQIARARPRLADLDGVIRLWVGDAERIDAPDGAYDAVVELTIFHHVPDWRRALAEVRRVLRPGGLFLFEELSRSSFGRPLLSPLPTVHDPPVGHDVRTSRRFAAPSRRRDSA
jgi:ubiquinone/menaquinone biosynthesis C-methylase UbiE